MEIPVFPINIFLVWRTGQLIGKHIQIILQMRPTGKKWHVNVQTFLKGIHWGFTLMCDRSKSQPWDPHWVVQRTVLSGTAALQQNWCPFTLLNSWGPVLVSFRCSVATLMDANGELINDSKHTHICQNSGHLRSKNCCMWCFETIQSLHENNAPDSNRRERPCALDLQLYRNISQHKF